MRSPYAAAILLLLFAAASFGQTTYATITGAVTDPSGAIVPNATITVTSVERNTTTSTVSNEAGAYTVPQLPEGLYRFKASAAGFKDFVVEEVRLVSREIRRIDVTFQMGAAATVLEVSGGAVSLIETETARISDVKNAETLKNMPLNARWLWAYFNTQIPGMQPGSGGYRFNGSSPGEGNFSIDGTTINDGRGGQIGPQLNYMESYQEVNVDTANNSAEFGAIGNVSVVTKSGGNQLHGAVFDTFNTPGLRARNFFSSGIWTGRWHIFGGGVGGPVVIPKLYDGRNKTFFYGSFERSAGSSSVDVLNAGVPLPSWREGDFSGLLPGVAIYDPATGLPFPGNKIPKDRINGVSQKIQDRFYPLPNTGDSSVFQGVNYRENKTRRWVAPWQGTGRVDHHFSEKNFVYGRFNITGSPVEYWQSNLPTVGQLKAYRATRSASFSYTHVFSPSLLSEARWGMDYNHYPWSGPVRGLDEVKRLGLTGLAPDLPDLPGMLMVNWDGIGLQQLYQWNGANPGYRNHNEHFQEHMSWFRGRHSLKFGVDLVRNGYAQREIPDELFGSVRFSPRFTSGGHSGQGHPYADFLLGIPTQSSRAFPPVLIEMGRWQYGFYVQDDFKVSPKVTVGLGIRYQLHQPWTDLRGRVAMFDIAQRSIVVPDGADQQISPLFPSSYVPVIASSKAGLPGSLIRPDRNDWGPRVSVAYRPFGNSNTVFRAGYGIYYDPVPYDVMATGSPFVLSEFPYTNPEENPDVIFPRVYPDRSAGQYSSIRLPAAVNPNLRTPWSHQYSAVIEHQRWDTGFKLSYTGTAQRQGTYQYDINAPVPDARPYVEKARPFPQYPGISYLTNGAGHQYHGLTASARRSMFKGLQYQFSWTWQRDIYDALRAQAIENPFDRKREIAVAPDVPTHRVLANWFWELPFGRGRRVGSNMSRWADLVAGGWVLTGAHEFKTGDFLTPMWSGPDPTGTVYSDSSTPQWVTIRPDQLRDPNFPSGERTMDRWFDPTAFAAPGVGRFGTAAKGVIKGPSRTLFNAGVQKHLMYKEGGPRMILEMTFRNLLNHPNWGNPSTNISETGSVGRITWAQSEDYGERQGRLGLRIEW